MTPNTPLLAALLLLSPLLPAPAAAQSRMDHGVRVPKSFITKRGPAPARPRKGAYDTLQYNALSRIKSDFVVNSGCGPYGADQDQIAVAADEAGNFLCTWVDARTGEREIDAQLFDSTGRRTGDMIRVSGNYNYWNSAPNIVYNRVTGEYIVVWAESGEDVRFQRIGRTGSLNGKNVTANQLWLTNTDDPSASTDSAGNIIMTWYSDVTCCEGSIPYWRVFDRQGNPITDQLPLADPTSNFVSSTGWDGRIAADSAGRSVVVWSTYFNQHSRIVLQVLDRAGVGLPLMPIVSDPKDTTDHYFPTVTGTRDGHFLVLWSSNSAIQGRIYQIDSGFVTPQFTVAPLSSGWATYAAAAGDRNQFSVIWTDDAAFGRVITVHGDSTGPATRLLFSTTVPWWYYPSVARGAGNRLILAYSGYDHTQSDVMVQILDPGLHPVAPSVKAADDGCTAWQTNPVVKFNADGRSLVAWEDQRNGNHDLYGQVLDQSGNPVGGNILLNDTAHVHYPAGVAVIPDHDGNFVLSYAARDYSSRAITVQKVAATGTKLGPPKTATDLFYDYSPPQDGLAVNDAGEFLLTWFGGGYATSPVYAQRLHPDLSLNGKPVIVLNGEAYPANARKTLCLSTNNRLEMFVAWLDFDYKSSAPGRVIKGMKFNQYGENISDTLRIDTVAGDPQYYTATCVMDNEGNYALLGYDGSTLNLVRKYAAMRYAVKSTIDLYYGSPHLQILRFENLKLLASWNTPDEVRAVLFDDGFSLLTPMTLGAISPPPPFASHTSYSADTHGDVILIAYESNADPQTGYDIHANTQSMKKGSFSSPIYVVEHVSGLYPNPTSGSARLQYEIAEPLHVTIALYNVLGQKVLDVERGDRVAGVYEVSVDTRGLSTGVYFIRYQGFGIVGQKILVIK